MVSVEQGPTESRLDSFDLPFVEKVLMIACGAHEGMASQLDRQFDRFSALASQLDNGAEGRWHPVMVCRHGRSRNGPDERIARLSTVDPGSRALLFYPVCPSQLRSIFAFVRSVRVVQSIATAAEAMFVALARNASQPSFGCCRSLAITVSDAVVRCELPTRAAAGIPKRLCSAWIDLPSAGVVRSEFRQSEELCHMIKQILRKVEMAILMLGLASLYFQAATFAWQSLAGLVAS